VLGIPVILGPVHVAFFEMVIEPVCSLVFEVQEQEQDVTRRPPAAAGAADWYLRRAGVFLAGYWRGWPEGDVQAVHSFLSLRRSSALYS
jgi:Ca2+-transporting ATPase